MASIKVFPKMNKINKYGQVPIYLRITKKRRSKYIALDVYINPKDWNEKTGKVRSGVVNAKQINSYLSIKEAEAEATSLEMESRSNFVSAYDIKSKLSGITPGDFFTFVEKRIRERTEEFSIGTINHYNCVLKKLKAFSGKERLFFDELNVPFIRGFQEHLKNDLNNHTNTIHSNLKIIRTLINDATAEELMPIEKNPFNKIKLRSQKTSREFLLDDELDRLEKLELRENTILCHHRNLYIFSAYTAGIRISDLLTMRWKNFDGDHLYFIIKKNQEDISIKLPEKSLDMLTYYRTIAQSRKGETFIDPESFIFPFLKIATDESDKLILHKAISSATTYVNKSLREPTKKAKIYKNISFHTARHSWAVRALQKGMRIEYVSKLMGHSSVKHTEVYAKILNEELDKAMEVF
ncbi:integrase/recombinase XerD [Mucilaginibacter sp. UYP25]|uniref:site-specific integrase n=1 Tax=unclassified Mucilaginibacter TaxID=2617802 RepID=UPI0033921CBF